MSCSPFDVRDYFLNELAATERRAVEAHVKICSSCRDEFDRLRVMDAALRSVPEEEIPQRIAFVSDKIFEPSPWKRRLAAFWNSGARLGFASAAMLSCALVYFAAARPAQIAQVSPAQTAGLNAPATVTPAAAPVMSEAEIQRRIDLAVDKAVNASEKRQKLLMAKYDKEIAGTRGDLALAEDANYRLNSQNQKLQRQIRDQGSQATIQQEPQQ